jgi:hypothetical protein
MGQDCIRTTKAILYHCRRNILRMNLMYKEDLLLLHVAFVFLVVMMVPQANAWPPYNCPPDEWGSSEVFEACLDYEMGRPYDTDPSSQVQPDMSLSNIRTTEDLQLYFADIDRQAEERKQELHDAIAANFTTPDSENNFSSPGGLDRYLEAWDKNQSQNIGTVDVYYDIQKGNETVLGFYNSTLGKPIVVK